MPETYPRIIAAPVVRIMGLGAMRSGALNLTEWDARCMEAFGSTRPYGTRLSPDEWKALYYPFAAAELATTRTGRLNNPYGLR